MNVLQFKYIFDYNDNYFLISLIYERTTSDRT